jgi:hypothetical protein
VAAASICSGEVNYVPYEFKTGKIQLNSTTPVKILDGFDAPEGTEVTLRVSGSGGVYVGGPDVTASAGINLTSLVMPITLKSFGPADLYAICNVGDTPSVFYFFHQTEEVPCV